MKLIYIMDPLCGWCYGNSQNIIKLMQELGDKIDLEILPGGMWVNENTRFQNEELSNFIRSADSRLVSVTGVDISSAYNKLLDDYNIYLDSEPGCRAINVIQRIQPSLTLNFASELAKSRYIHGMDNTIPSTFFSICKNLGISEIEFQNTYESNVMIKYTQEIFIKASNYANSFPSIFFEKNRKIIPIPLMGYQYNLIKKEIMKYLI